jgi:hypothetical protein
MTLGYIVLQLVGDEPHLDYSGALFTTASDAEADRALAELETGGMFIVAEVAA